MEQLFYTVKEIAKILSLTEETIREKLRKGELKGIKIGKSWRIAEKQLKEFIDMKGEVK